MIQARQIDAFRAVMLTGKMTLAAEMIHVTQPAVSRLIRDLERTIGAALFERQGNKILPTAQAHALLGEVERSFIGMKRIQAFAEQMRSGRSGSLKIAALPAMAAGFLPRFVAEFSRSNPGIKILIDGLPSSLIRDGIMANTFDLGVTSAPFQAGGLHLAPIEDNAVVALPSGHRLASKRDIDVTDLRGEAIILLSKFANHLHPIERLLQSIGIRHDIETPLSTIACVLVSEGAGIAIVDPFSASEFVGRGVTIRALRPTVVFGTALIWSNQRPLSVAAAEFHTCLLAHIRTFLERSDYLRD